MLIHKSTMGVLDTFWTGAYRLEAPTGLQIPVNQEYSFQTAPELSPTEWWEVPRGSKLGRKLRMYYPWVDPIMDEAGELTDVEVQQKAPDGEQEAQKAALTQEARMRGYHRRGKVRPKNIMPFLAAKGEKP